MARSAEAPTWVRPGTPVGSIVDLPNGDLFLASYTRGVYRISGLSSTSADIAATPREIRIDLTPEPLTGAGLITIELPRHDHVRLTLHDILGQEIAILYDDEHAAGRITVELDRGTLTPGSYIIRMTTGTETTSRVLMIR